MAPIIPALIIFYVFFYSVFSNYILSDLIARQSKPSQAI